MLTLNLLADLSGSLLTDSRPECSHKKRFIFEMFL